MTEILSDNIQTHLPDILQAIQRATFIAIDTEFTALYLKEADKASLFDTAEDRYRKLCNTAKNIIPVQVGVTPFAFNPDTNVYEGQTYTFYIWPKPIMTINQSLQFQASSFQFLSRFDFDYNKLIYHGVPFLNDTQERQLRTDLESNACALEHANEDLLEDIILELNQWFHDAKDNKLTLQVRDKLKGDIEGLYHMQYYLRNMHQNRLWSEIDTEGNLVLSKVSKEKFAQLNLERPLAQETITMALGFTHVFRALVRAKKPIVGHNMLTDMLLLQNTFGDTLPPSYANLKRVLHEQFPTLYDTKTLSFHVRRMIPKNAVWQHNTLQDLYDYFKDGHGRHLAFNSPLIKEKFTSECDHFHDAGWDSYCTGYCFVRMAHFLAAKGYQGGGNTRDIMSTEHLAAVQPHCNHLNLIRAALSHMDIAGNDPISTRPPCLVAESPKLDISQVALVLSEYGYVEIKQISANRALIAVDNWGNAKRILKSSGTTKEFTIQRYKFIKHSKYARPLLLGLVGIGLGALLVAIVDNK